MRWGNKREGGKTWHAGANVRVIPLTPTYTLNSIHLSLLSFSDPFVKKAVKLLNSHTCSPPPTLSLSLHHSPFSKKAKSEPNKSIGQFIKTTFVLVLSILQEHYNDPHTISPQRKIHFYKHTLSLSVLDLSVSHILSLTV